MKRTDWLQETRKMRFEKAFSGWQEGRLTQDEAARLRGVRERTFRRRLSLHEESGLDGGGRSYGWVKNALQADGAVGNDNCVRFKGLTLQIPPDKHRCHYVKTKVRVRRYCNIFHGPRKMCVYDTQGKEIKVDNRAAA